MNAAEIVPNDVAISYGKRTKCDITDEWMIIYLQKCHEPIIGQVYDVSQSSDQ